MDFEEGSRSRNSKNKNRKNTRGLNERGGEILKGDGEIEEKGEKP